MENDELRVLAIVPSGYCFGLQNLTLSFFGNAPGWLVSHFLNTRWNDGEFPRRLDAMGLPHSETWFGMFSRKLDRTNVRMTIECLAKLPITWWDFMSVYRRFRPHIIYFANHHELILLFPMLVWIRHKVVCHIHDPPPPNRFQKRSFALWRRAVARFLFISDSAATRMGLLGSLGAASSVVHNGVEISDIELPRQRGHRFCAQFGWPADSVVIGITGQLTAQKGHEDFIAGAALAFQSNHHLRFVIGGKAQSPYIERLRQLIVDARVEHAFGFSGWLDHPSIFYEAIDVLVLASRHEEGFGLVLAEASERAVPVIATRSGGAMEVVVHRETGLLVDRGDSRGIAAAMTQMGDPDLRLRLGEAARVRVARDFDLKRQAMKFAVTLRETHQGR